MGMRLANLVDGKIPYDRDATFGELLFSDMRRTVYKQGEDGKATEEVKRRTYDLKARGWGGMVSISLPADIPQKNFPYNAEVLVVNPKALAVAEGSFRGAEAKVYFSADDIVLKGAAAPNGSPPSGSPKTADPKPGSNQQSGDGQQPKKD